MDSIILIVAMIAVFYFMIIRPENKRKKQAVKRLSMKKRMRIALFFYFCQISQAAKACKSNISNPFFTTAPFSVPFRMNSVSSGLYSRS